MDWQSFGIGVCVGVFLWNTLYWSIHKSRPTKREPDRSNVTPKKRSGK